jgi:hypothetical protein
MPHDALSGLGRCDRDTGTLHAQVLHTLVEFSLAAPFVRKFEHGLAVSVARETHLDLKRR